MIICPRCGQDAMPKSTDVGFCNHCHWTFYTHTFVVKEGTINMKPDEDVSNTIFGPNDSDPRKNSFAPPIQEPVSHWTSHDPPIDIGEKDAEVLAQGGTQFETGAVRSSDKANVRYDLISPIGMRRLAETMEEGRKKYGYFNWERGMPIGDILNHAIAHIYAYLEGKPTGEDDLAHAAWGLFAAMHMEETHPNLAHQVRQTVTDNILGKTEVPKDELNKDGQIRL